MVDEAQPLMLWRWKEIAQRRSDEQDEDEIQEGDEGSLCAEAEDVQSADDEEDNVDEFPAVEEAEGEEDFGGKPKASCELPSRASIRLPMPSMASIRMTTQSCQGTADQELGRGASVG